LGGKVTFVRWIKAIVVPLAVMSLLSAFSFQLSAFGLLRFNIQCTEHFGHTNKNICDVSWGELAIHLYMFLTFGISSILSSYCAARLAPSHPRAFSLIILLIGGSFTLFMMSLE
jgi:hypothetical protein